VQGEKPILLPNDRGRGVVVCIERYTKLGEI